MLLCKIDIYVLFYFSWICSALVLHSLWWWSCSIVLGKSFQLRSKRFLSAFSNHSIPASPALFALQETSVSSDLPLQPHLGVEELAVALSLGGQPTPHLLQLALQPGDDLGKVLQLVGVQLLGALQGALQAFLLQSKRQGAFRTMTTVLIIRLNNSVSNLRNHVDANNVTSMYSVIVGLNPRLRGEPRSLQCWAIRTLPWFEVHKAMFVCEMRLKCS